MISFVILFVATFFTLIVFNSYRTNIKNKPEGISNVGEWIRIHGGGK
jgi:hypothetical protein